MPRSALSWKSTIYYGEVVGFLLAWVAGVAALTQDWSSPSEETIDRVAAVEAGDAWSTSP